MSRSEVKELIQAKQLVDEGKYRLALIFDACVGILEKIAGSSLKLLQDPSWQNENLTNVENDSESIKTFLTQ